MFPKSRVFAWFITRFLPLWNFWIQGTAAEATLHATVVILSGETLATRLLSGTIVTELASAFHGGNQWKTHGETNGNPHGGCISWRNPCHGISWWKPMDNPWWMKPMETLW